MPTDDSQPQLPVIALCASAGGLEAYQNFFEVLPTTNQMAFVVIQHVIADHESILHEILQRSTDVPVHSIQDGMRVEPNQVYVLPAGYDVQIKDQHLTLSKRKPHLGWPRTIDNFLLSLAEDKGDLAGAVIFSGAGTDGLEGSQAIKKKGGLVIAQNIASAKQQGMPVSIIQAGLASAILNPEHMPQFLQNYYHIISEDARLDDLMDRITDDEVQQVTRYLQQEVGHDFSDYKMSTLKRQITRRMSAHLLSDVQEYKKYLRNQPSEAEVLSRYLLINVTSFFRNPEAFESLKTNALMPMLRDLSIDTVFRIWVPGCATGEEAVSIAIIVYECLRELDKLEMIVRIFATDLSSGSLQIARTGRYPKTIADEITPQRLRDHLVQENGEYRVRAHINRMIIWSEHNLVEHPPFSSLHLISCRNILIYFQRHLQARLLALFQFALQPSGILFLGTAESLPPDNNNFITIDSKNKIFRCLPGAKHAWLHLDQPLFVRIPDYEKFDMGEIRGTQNQPVDDELEVIRRALFSYYDTTCALIDESHRLRYTFGDIDRYLRIVPGREGQHNILDMAREGLGVELTVILHQAQDQDEPITRSGIWVKSQNVEYKINLTVLPVSSTNLNKRYLLVIFERTPDERLEVDNAEADNDDSTSEGATLKRMRAELAETKQTLKNITRALQAKSDELTSSMEEIRSANEEIQTTNEELRTSKEELESMNEELNTLNSQLTNQNQALSLANNTLHNFLQSAEIGMIFLDQNLYIREYTSAITDIFSLRPSDKNRPLIEIANRLDYNQLTDDAEKVLDTLQNRQIEVRANDSRWYKLHIQPYRTTTGIIDGLVLTFIDITLQKQAQAELEQQRLAAHRLLGTIDKALLELNQDLTIQTANSYFYDVAGLSEADVAGRSIINLAAAQGWDTDALQKLLTEIIPEQNSVEDYELPANLPGKGPHMLHISVHQFAELQRILLLIDDITASDEPSDQDAAAQQ